MKIPAKGPWREGESGRLLGSTGKDDGDEGN